MMLTQYQAAARIRDLIGSSFRLPMGHELVKWEFTNDLVKAVVLTARVKSNRGGLVVTHRGMIGYQWMREPTGEWSALEPVRVDWKLDTPEFWSKYSSKTDIDRALSDAWARLCYRPGNHKVPMDGPGGSNPSV